MSLAAWQERGGRAWQAVFYAPSLLFGAVVSARAAAFRSGWLETVRFPVPVFCVGNVTAGGTGKTPGAIWLAAYLQSKGRRPALVTRGYGRADERSVVVVSDGQSLRADVHEAGDEALLMAKRLPHVPVVAGADRARAVRQALERFSVDSVVLDDGFQHHRLCRDVNLLCWDALDSGNASLPAHGLRTGAWLLPAGRGREPLSALRRAHVIFLTKANLCPEDRLALLKEGLARWAPGVPVVPVAYFLSFWHTASQEPWPPGKMAGLPVLALSGLARPQSFEESLVRLGAQVATRRHPDHYWFRSADLESALAKARAEKRTVVVTEKDYQRLPAGFPCVVARLEWRPDMASSSWTEKIDSVIS